MPSDYFFTLRAEAETMAALQQIVVHAASRLEAAHMGARITTPRGQGSYEVESYLLSASDETEIFLDQIERFIAQPIDLGIAGSLSIVEAEPTMMHVLVKLLEHKIKRKDEPRASLSCDRIRSGRDILDPDAFLVGLALDLNEQYFVAICLDNHCYVSAVGPVALNSVTLRVRETIERLPDDGQVALLTNDQMNQVKKHQRHKHVPYLYSSSDASPGLF